MHSTPPPPSFIFALVKRLVDLTAASVVLVLAAPLLLAIAVAIKATSHGPVLFRQERLGRNGTRFRLYKLRTMHDRAEDVLGACPDLYQRYVAGGYKLPDAEDPRITAVGRFLRRTNMDELPQLLNVLRGDMSLVGPRPIVPAEAGRYPQFAANLRCVRPGITGPWQIQREAGADYGLRAALDRDYATACCLRGDAVILQQTVLALLGAPRRAATKMAVDPDKSPAIRTSDPVA